MDPSGSCVLVRRATRQDIDELERLESASFAQDRLSRRSLVRHSASASAGLFVAADPASILGYALVFYRERSCDARLYSIASRASARGRGVGSALLDAVEADARARGCQRMVLEVRPDNSSAREFYVARGYRPFGTYPDFYEDGAPAERLAKPLTAVLENRAA